MHTNENQSKPRNKSGAGPRVAPGQQVASNKAMHCNMRLIENESGEYDPVVDRVDQPTLVRGEYHPIGNLFHYPKQWGRKYAAEYLIQSKIKIQQDILTNAQSELEKLQRCLDKVQHWSDKDE